MRLDTESLRAFRAVVAAGSFTAAAAELHLTQSAVSWKIKRLEQRLGSPLLIRSERSLRPTDFGHELLIHADRLITVHDEAVESLTRSQLEGNVRVGSNDEVTANDVATVVRRFATRHPLVRVHLAVTVSGRLTELVRDAKIDIALMQILDPSPDDDVFWTEQLGWYSSPSFVLQPGEPVPLITFGEHCLYRPMMEAALDAAGIEHYVMFEAESSAAVTAAINASLGVAVMCEYSVTPGPVRWSMPGLDDRLPTASFVARINRRNRSQAVRTLVEDLRLTLVAPTQLPQPK